MIIEFFLQALRNLHPEYTAAEIDEIKKELKAGLPPFSADTAPALIGNIIAGRIANRLDFMGPSFTVDAACASALLAIEIGVGDLLSRKYDMVLAGGANVNAPLPTLGLFCQLGALSRREQIRPFDKDADGTILGEGLGMIVLKRREDAERDGDRIYAIIKGVGVASDGRAVHVMAPRVEGEELALRRAYEMAGVSPGTVGLIEAHGTATPVGDVVEVQALSAGIRRTPREPAHLRHGLGEVHDRPYHARGRNRRDHQDRVVSLSSGLAADTQLRRAEPRAASGKYAFLRQHRDAPVDPRGGDAAARRGQFFRIRRDQCARRARRASKSLPAGAGRRGQHDPLRTSRFAP